MNPRPLSAPQPLQLRWGLFAALLAMVGLAVFAQMAERQSAPVLAQECAVVAQIAPAVTNGPVVREIGDGDDVLDCGPALATTGLPLISRRGPQHEPPFTRFSRVSFVRQDRFAIVVGRVCGLLCGEGIETTFERRGGRWVVVDRRLSWIS